MRAWHQDNNVRATIANMLLDQCEHGIMTTMFVQLYREPDERITNARYCDGNSRAATVNM